MACPCRQVDEDAAHPPTAHMPAPLTAHMPTPLTARMSAPFPPPGSIEPFGGPSCPCTDPERRTACACSRREPLAAFSRALSAPPSSAADTPARGSARLGMGVLAHDGQAGTPTTGDATQTEGVDVSGYQGNVAWSTLWSSGVSGPHQGHRRA